jgi:hypothetical protein
MARKNLPLRLTDKSYYCLLKLKERYQEFSLNMLIEMAITKLARDLGISYEDETRIAKDVP